MPDNDDDRDDRRAELFARWCQSLGLEPVDVDPDTDYFSLGGTSFQAVEFIDSAERDLGVAIPIDTFFIEGTFTAVIDSVLESRP